MPPPAADVGETGGCDDGLRSVADMAFENLCAAVDVDEGERQILRLDRLVRAAFVAGFMAGGRF